RDAVDATGAGVNLAGLVGHSPLRLAVMGDDAWTRAATEAERRDMAQLLDVAMAQGAFGLSTSYLDVDHLGRPVPSRAADGAELHALLDVVYAAGRGVLEVVPGLLDGRTTEQLDDLAARCGPRGIPLTWTGFTDVAGTRNAARHIEQAKRYQDEGVQLYPQM